MNNDLFFYFRKLIDKNRVLIYNIIATIRNSLQLIATNNYFGVEK